MNHLSGKDKKQMQSHLPKGYSVDKKDEVVMDNNNVIFKNKNPYLIQINDQYLPHLRSLDSVSGADEEDSIPSVFIDKGAIPFLLKGADMMRPGIQRIEGEFEKNALVIIRDENHNKPLGLGYALESSQEMRNSNSGKVIEVIHYVQDEYYSS